MRKEVSRCYVSVLYMHTDSDRQNKYAHPHTSAICLFTIEVRHSMLITSRVGLKMWHSEVHVNFVKFRPHFLRQELRCVRMLHPHLYTHPHPRPDTNPHTILAHVNIVFYTYTAPLRASASLFSLSLTHTRALSLSHSNTQTPECSIRIWQRFVK